MCKRLLVNKESLRGTECEGSQYLTLLLVKICFEVWDAVWLDECLPSMQAALGSILSTTRTTEAGSQRLKRMQEQRHSRNMA